MVGTLNDEIHGFPKDRKKSCGNVRHQLAMIQYRVCGSQPRSLFQLGLDLFRSLKRNTSRL